MRLLRGLGRHAPLAVGVLVGAVGLIVVAVAQPHLRSPDEDMSDEYDEIAINLVEHGRFSANLANWERATVTRGPGYPMYLAGVFAVFGPRNARAVGTADMLVFALSSALLTATLQVFVAAPAAAAGGLAFAFWPTTFYYAAKGTSETLLDLFLVASLGALVALQARPGSLRAAALGVCLGLACLTRGSAVILLLVVAAWLGASVARRVQPWRLVMVVAAAWTLTMSPWWLRNARVAGEFVPFHSLTWYNAYHDDVFDRTRQWLASQGLGSVDWLGVDRSRIPESLPRHPPGFEYPGRLDARADLAQERRYRAIMLEKFKGPGYLLDKVRRNAADFWSAAASTAKSRKLFLTSLAWLALYVVGLTMALRRESLRGPALACLAFVVLTWMLYLPFLALFRHSIPTAPFIAATLGLGLGSRAPGGRGAGPRTSVASEGGSGTV